MRLIDAEMVEIRLNVLLMGVFLVLLCNCFKR